MILGTGMIREIFVPANNLGNILTILILLIIYREIESKVSIWRGHFSGKKKPAHRLAKIILEAM
ncbi:hypothetical protein RC92_04535 [Pectobacterium brasiliense]|nr:hypothetical protein NC16_11730 [Pectobacterium brasiliense]KHT09405.1 hypothetical protein RC92_04535 [Pectobacterium brasiliense]